MSRLAAKKSLVALMVSIAALTAVICCFVPLVVLSRNNQLITIIALVTIVVLLIVDGVCIGALLRARKSIGSRVR